MLAKPVGRAKPLKQPRIERPDEEGIFSVEEDYDIDDSQTLEDQNDIEIVHGAEGNSSPTSSGKKRRVFVRGRGFSVEEDELICRSWLNLWQDGSTGSAHRECPIYDRMRDAFNEVMEQAKHRTPKSLKHRWQIINKAVSKFCGYLSQLESRNLTGGTFQDMYDEAKRAYSRNDEKNKPFEFELCWQILHVSPKWHKYKESLGAPSTPIRDVDPEGGKAKDIRLNGHQENESYAKQADDNTNFEPFSSQQLELMNLVGNDKFEGMSSQQELLNLVKDLCKRNKELYDRWISSMNRMEEQKERDREEKATERAQRNSLSAKQLEMITMQCEMLRSAEQERLRREDERVLALPLANMDEFERQYYENRKREIVARSSSSHGS